MGRQGSLEGLGLLTTPPRHIALLAPCYWPEVRRGTERFIRELADGLVVDGHRPSLITSHRGRPSWADEGGLRVARLPRPPHGLLDRRHFEDHLTHLPLTSAALLAARPEVAHALFPVDGLAAAGFARATGRPAVLSYMGIPETSWLKRRRLRRRVLARAAAGCDAVVALSDVAAAEFERTLGIQARVINPGVDVETFKPGGARAERPTILCAASVTEPAKRVAQLVEAFALLRRRVPDARLVLSRPRGGAIHAVAGEGIELADVDSRSALVDAYRDAWVSALPSEGEAFGLVLVESLACGTPAVGRRAGAIPEVLDGEDVGVLFEGGPPELAAALLEGLELAGEPATAARCRSHAERFSTRRSVDAYELLYEELLDARG